MADLLGSTVEQLSALTWARLCDPKLFYFPGDWVWATFERGTAQQCRAYYVHHGQRRMLHMQTFPIVAEGGEVEQTIVHVVDATERLQTEAMAIHNERLAATGKLAATLAHELNTPLQSIHNCLYLADTSAAVERSGYLSLARAEIGRISTILQRLLDLHRPNQAQEQHFDLNQVIERVVLLTNHMLQERRIHVKVTAQPQLPQLWGSANEVIQVLLNLILNAADAMPAGGELRLLTSLHTPAHGPPAVECCLTDTGTGIPPEVLAHIFEPFFSTKPQGSGLGLAISQKIVAQHGGTLTVHSLPEHGTTFRLRLPVTQP